MTDLYDRLRVTQDIATPDLWEDIQHRVRVGGVADRPRPRAVRSSASRRESERKWVTIAVAFAIAMPAIAMAVRALHKPEPSNTQGHAVSNHVLPVTTYAVRSAYGPGEIAAGSVGGAWFTLPGDDEMGRITPAGSVVTFALPGSLINPTSITKGSKGGAWFLVDTGGSGCNAGSPCPYPSGVGRIDASGIVTEYPLPSVIQPFAIALGPDGDLWITGMNFSDGNGWIGRMSSSGEVASIPVKLQSEPASIVTGPDGALWFAEYGVDPGAGIGAIGRLTTSGTLTEYILPTPAGHRSGARDIAVGSDGNLWFTWATNDVGPGDLLSIGRITPSGTITRFPVSDHSRAGSITTASDGSLWFTFSDNLVGRILENGTITYFSLENDSSVSDIASAAHGIVWFTDPASMSVGRFQIPHHKG